MLLTISCYWHVWPCLWAVYVSFRVLGVCTALVAQDGALLRATTIWAGELLLVGSLGASLLRLCCSVMVVEWYTRMVSMLHRRVFRGKLLYGANCMTEGLDNVDQRVVMDTRALANDTITFLASALSLFANVASAVISAAQFGLLPTVLPLGYAVLGTAVTVLIMKPIVGLTYVKNAWEGSFRFHHVRNREFGESIAFFNVRAPAPAGGASTASLPLAMRFVVAVVAGWCRDKRLKAASRTACSTNCTKRTWP